MIHETNWTHFTTFLGTKEFEQKQRMEVWRGTVTDKQKEVIGFRVKNKETTRRRLTER